MYIYLIITNILVFFIGNIFGSIMNIVISRSLNKEKIMKKGIYCDHCKTKLKTYETIPFFSYIFLGGRCRHCKKEINKNYFIAELSTGIIFLILFNAFNPMTFSKIPTSMLSAKMLSLAFIPLILGYMYILSALDMIDNRIDRKTMLYGIVTLATYTITDAIVHKKLYQMSKLYIMILLIYVCLIIILTQVQLANYKRKKKPNYAIDQIMYILLISIFFGSKIMIVSLIATTIIYSIFKLKAKNERIALTPIITVTTLTTYILYIYSMCYIPFSVYV